MSVDIVAENALAGTFTLDQMKPGAQQGDISVAGFAREMSVNVGETVHFSVTGGSTIIRIFRAGWYGGDTAFREIASIPNQPVEQPELVTMPDTYGATTGTAWSTTAEWGVPVDAVSGMYVAMIRNATNTDAFYATFVVRDDAAEADIIYKTSETTWGAAYNHFGTKANIHGKNIYGSGVGVGNSLDRCLAASYHRPVITRGGVMQTYWWSCELPLIRFLERNGYSVKYISSVDLDKRGLDLLMKGKIFLSSGHDEYWSQPMRDAVETWRDEHAGRLIFMSGNEVFWRVRFEYVGDETIMWCYKDTLNGPTGSGHVAGQPFDPVTWTGTWMDTRWPEHRDGAWLTGTKFGMNGVYDYDVIVPQNPYAGLKVWGGSSLVDSDITLVAVLGFEADHLYATQPEESVRILASYTRAAPGGLSDANGENYNVPGNIEWGIIAQRYAGGGFTVGFGTAQWAWALDGTHDRGTSQTSVDAQQFTINLLHDMGATPSTIMPEGMLRAAVPLDEYAVEPGKTPLTLQRLQGYRVDGSNYVPVEGYRSDGSTYKKVSAFRTLS